MVPYPKRLANGWKIGSNIQNISILLPKHKIALYSLLLIFFFFFKFLTLTILKENDSEVELCIDVIWQKLIYRKYFHHT